MIKVTLTNDILKKISAIDSIRTEEDIETVLSNIDLIYFEYSKPTIDRNKWIYCS